MGKQTHPRNRTADLLKGAAVILMVQVHLMELFARQDIFDSLFGTISLFLGGPPAAPVFMAVMGYFIAKSKRSFRQSVVRGIQIILLGFILNIGLNFHLLVKIATGSLALNPLPYLFGVDILFLAGLSIVALAAVKLIRIYPFVFYGIVLVGLFGIQFIIGYLWQPATENYLLAYFYGEGTWWSYFPFIPWFAYPLTGFIYYQIEGGLRSFVSKYLVYIILAYATIVIVFMNFGLGISSDLEQYYHHGVLFYVYTVFILIAWSALAWLVTGKYNNRVLRYVQWLGEHVTAAYVIQWLVIGNIATALYKTQSLTAVLLWFVMVLVITSGGIWLWERRKKWIGTAA